MKFLREIIIEHLTPDMLNMEKQGDIVLLWKDDSIEIWIPKTAEERLAA